MPHQSQFAVAREAKHGPANAARQVAGRALASVPFALMLASCTVTKEVEVHNASAAPITLGRAPLLGQSTDAKVLQPGESAGYPLAKARTRGISVPLFAISAGTANVSNTVKIGKGRYQIPDQYERHLDHWKSLSYIGQNRYRSGARVVYRGEGDVVFIDGGSEVPMRRR